MRKLLIWNFQAFTNSKKNSCRGNYMRKYGIYFSTKTGLSIPGILFLVSFLRTIQSVKFRMTPNHNLETRVPCFLKGVKIQKTQCLYQHFFGQSHLLLLYAIGVWDRSCNRHCNFSYWNRKKNQNKQNFTLFIFY